MSFHPPDQPAPPTRDASVGPAAPQGRPPPAADASSQLDLMRELFAKVDALEAQNASLMKELAELRGLKSGPVAQDSPGETHEPEPKKAYRATPLEPVRSAARMQEEARRKRRPTVASTESASDRASAKAASQRQIDALHSMLSEDQTSGPADPAMSSKNVGKIRSKVRLRFRFFSMSRLHALLAGFCIAVGSIAGAVGQALGIVILHYSGLTFAVLGLIYMMITGIVAFTFHLTHRDEEIVEVAPTPSNRPSQSILSHVFYMIGRLFHTASKP